MSGADRLSRLLMLVPYFQARPGISINEAADDLGATPQALRDDLQLLFMCGLPGYGPGDLIDLQVHDDDTVTITFDAGMNRPLRLDSAEALALLVALRALAEIPGLATSEVLSRALAKIEAAAGPSVAATAATKVAVRTYADTETMQAVSGALQRKHALHITYYSATRDVLSERTVDPIRLVLSHGTAYLSAWCRIADAVRLFRLDRIDAISELDEPAIVPTQSVDVAPGELFRPRPDWPAIQLRVGLESRWITEYYPCERVIAEAGSTWLVTLRASDLAWARRLVMRLGADVEIVAPEELAADVVLAARAALEAYE